MLWIALDLSRISSGEQETKGQVLRTRVFIYVVHWALVQQVMWALALETTFLSKIAIWSFLPLVLFLLWILWIERLGHKISFLVSIGACLCFLLIKLGQFGCNLHLLNIVSP